MPIGILLWVLSSYVYFWLMAPQCIEDFWAQINLYMLFNQHDFTATLCISLTSLDYF